MTSTVDQDRGAAVDLRAATLRRDTWWVAPLITVVVLGGFVVYATWVAFVLGSKFTTRRKPPAGITSVALNSYSMPLPSFQWFVSAAGWRS